MVITLQWGSGAPQAFLESPGLTPIDGQDEPEMESLRRSPSFISARIG